jgi:hypothetical protein
LSAQFAEVVGNGVFHIGRCKIQPMGNGAIEILEKMHEGWNGRFGCPGAG